MAPQKKKKGRPKANKSARNEEENRSNRRNKTMELRNARALTTLLQSCGFGIKHIAPDGNCLFRAFADQMHGVEDEHMKEREKTMQYLKAHQSEFECFIEDDEPFNHYIKRMSQPSVWAGNLELHILSLIYKVNVVVHQQNEPTYVLSNFSDDTECVQLSFHNVAHYNSVRLASDTANCCSAKKLTLKEIKNSSGILLRGDDAYAKDESLSKQPSGACSSPPSIMKHHEVVDDTSVAAIDDTKGHSPPNAVLAQRRDATLPMHFAPGRSIHSAYRRVHSNPSAHRFQRHCNAASIVKTEAPNARKRVVSTLESPSLFCDAVVDRSAFSTFTPLEARDADKSNGLIYWSRHTYRQQIASAYHRSKSVSNIPEGPIEWNSNVDPEFPRLSKDDAASFLNPVSSNEPTGTHEKEAKGGGTVDSDKANNSAADVKNKAIGEKVSATRIKREQQRSKRLEREMRRIEKRRLQRAAPNGKQLSNDEEDIEKDYSSAANNLESMFGRLVRI